VERPFHRVPTAQEPRHPRETRWKRTSQTEGDKAVLDARAALRRKLALIDHIYKLVSLH
jgi:hypothetical protein